MLFSQPASSTEYYASWTDPEYETTGPIYVEVRDVPGWGIYLTH